VASGIAAWEESGVSEMMFALILHNYDTTEILAVSSERDRLYSYAANRVDRLFLDWHPFSEGFRAEIPWWDNGDYFVVTEVLEV
jgi:hypothetical protein